MTLILSSQDFFGIKNEIVEWAYKAILSFESGIGKLVEWITQRSKGAKGQKIKTNEIPLILAEKK